VQYKITDPQPDLINCTWWSISLKFTKNLKSPIQHSTPNYLHLLSWATWWVFANYTNGSVIKIIAEFKRRCYFHRSAIVIRPLSTSGCLGMEQTFCMCGKSYVTTQLLFTTGCKTLPGLYLILQQLILDSGDQRTFSRHKWKDAFGLQSQLYQFVTFWPVKEQNWSLLVFSDFWGSSFSSGRNLPKNIKKLSYCWSTEVAKTGRESCQLTHMLLSHLTINNFYQTSVHIFSPIHHRRYSIQLLTKCVTCTRLTFKFWASSQLMPSRILDCGPAVTLSAK